MFVCLWQRRCVIAGCPLLLEVSTRAVAPSMVLSCESCEMDTLRKQIARARRRLMLEQFLGVLAWSWFGTLLVAAIAIFVQKQWLTEVRGWNWAVAWLGGAAAVGF